MGHLCAQAPTVKLEPFDKSLGGLRCQFFGPRFARLEVCSADPIVARGKGTAKEAVDRAIAELLPLHTAEDAMASFRFPFSVPQK